MKEKVKEKAAFICPLGFYQIERMPHGITGAVAILQRLMNLLQLSRILDDLVIVEETLNESEESSFSQRSNMQDADCCRRNTTTHQLPILHYPH